MAEDLVKIKQVWGGCRFNSAVLPGSLEVKHFNNLPEKYGYQV